MSDEVARVVLSLDDDGKNHVEISGTAPDVLWLLEKARFSIYQQMGKTEVK